MNSTACLIIPYLFRPIPIEIPTASLAEDPKEAHWHALPFNRQDESRTAENQIRFKRGPHTFQHRMGIDESITTRSWIRLHWWWINKSWW